MSPNTGQKSNLGQLAGLACLLEVSAPKPGNVHRGADFEDMSFIDFAVSAMALVDPLNRVQETRVGECVLDCVKETRLVTRQNTNLGLILLLVPLAKAFSLRQVCNRESINEVLAAADSADTNLVYQAIRLARPSGLGNVEQADVANQTDLSLVDSMKLAEHRDLIAGQYANNFDNVRNECLVELRNCLDRGLSLTESIIHTHVVTMSIHPDSLIQRKCGVEIANQSAALAARVVNAGDPTDASYLTSLGELDFWLRADGHRRNPGTTADLIGATIFCALLDATIKFPITV